MCLERYLVEQCAPTLASIKTGTMFGVIEADSQELMRQVGAWSEALEPKGLRLSVLRCRGGRALIYLGRVSQIARDISQPGAADLLSRYGYCTNVESALERLRERVCGSEGFPHEIGLFLGYPLADVLGYIQNRGRNSKCTGFWQVYGDEADAARKFSLYRRCSAVYRRLYMSGRSLDELTVSA